MKVGAVKIDLDLPESERVRIEQFLRMTDIETSQTRTSRVIAGASEQFAQYDQHHRYDVLSRVFPVYEITKDEHKYVLVPTNHYYCT